MSLGAFALVNRSSSATQSKEAFSSRALLRSDFAYELYCYDLTTFGIWFLALCSEWPIWRWMLLSSTTSLSIIVMCPTMSPLRQDIIPTPLPARYNTTGDPSPPAPITNTLARAIFSYSITNDEKQRPVPQYQPHRVLSVSNSVRSIQCCRLGALPILSPPLNRFV